jgi:hypothetical protein
MPLDHLPDPLDVYLHLGTRQLVLHQGRLFVTGEQRFCDIATVAVN